MGAARLESRLDRGEVDGLAAGSRKVCQLLRVAAKVELRDLLGYGLVIGLLAGFLTDAVVTAAGV